MPYALKAADADTLGGKPASAFVTTESLNSSSPGSAAMTGPASVSSTAQGANASSPKGQKGKEAPLASVTGSGTPNYVPLWTSSSTLGNSLIYQSGGNIGVGTTDSGRALEVSAVDSNTGLKITGTTSNRSWLMAVGATAGDGKLNIYDYGAAASRLTIDTKGNVGIGTTQPQAHVSLGGANGIKQLVYDGNANYNAGFGTDLVPGNSLDLFMGRGTGSDTALNIVAPTGPWPYTSYSAKVTVVENGNVGIGTTQPQGHLSLGGANGIKQLVYDGNANYNAGFGTDLVPGNSLDLFMGRGTGSDTALNIVAPTGPWPYTSYSAKVTVLENGNVGINNPNPSTTLDIVNNVAEASAVSAQATAINGMGVQGTAAVNGTGVLGTSLNASIGWRALPAAPAPSSFVSRSEFMALLLARGA